MKKIILASTSPRRKELLEKLGLDFEVLASDYEENMAIQMEPMDLAAYLSKGKAEAVAKDYNNHLIIGADTFIAFDNNVLGKPGTAEKAVETLKIISGKYISVISGLTIIDTGENKIISKALETKVYIKELSDSEIQNYVDSGEPLDKAGAFAIQGLGAIFVEKIEGDYYNVMGLPLFLLSELLKEFGVNIL